MATAALTNSSQGTQNALHRTAQALVVALAWGAIMLFVFGSWVRAKPDGTTEGVARILKTVLLAGGGISALLALWQGFTLWFKKETPDQKIASLTQQHRLLSFVLLAGGFALILVAIVLGFGRNAAGSYIFIRENFAESFGALLFGAMVLFSGYSLQQPAGSAGITVEFLIGKIPVLKLSQLVICVLAIGSLLYIYYKNRDDNAWRNYLPEMAGLLFLSLLCFACFLYLNTPNLDEFGIRLFVLLFGGVVGMLLFLWCLWRTILWRDDILLGGAAAWEGPNAYRFWLCAYVLFVSLVLMFFSFNLARADIRTNVVLRRVMYGYDAVVQGLLMLGILYILNIVVYALVPFTFDWTKTRGAYAMSESSKNLIIGLKKEDTNIVVLMPSGSPVYKDLRVLLDNFHALNHRVKVTYISPDFDDEKYEKLVELFPKILPDSPVAAERRGVLLIAGPMPEDAKHNLSHSFVNERKLQDFDGGMRGQKAKVTFKGESEIIKELKFLAQGKKQQKVYILQTDDAVDMNSQGPEERTDVRSDFSKVGIGILVDQLKKDNYDVSGLNFGIELPEQKVANVVFVKGDGASKRKDVPSDCKVLIIAGVVRHLPKETLDAIEGYADRGGKMLVFLDLPVESDYKLRQTNLESMLKRFGIEITNEVPMRVGGPGDPRTLWATTPGKSENPLGRGFAGQRIDMRRSARAIQPAAAPGRYKSEVVLHQDLRRDRLTILPKDVGVLGDVQKFIRGLVEDERKFAALWSKKAFPLAVAVSEADKPRLVVFADTDFITNRDMEESPSRAMNYAFVVGSLEWMADREGGIGSLPKVTNTFQLSPEVNVARMILMPGWLMLLVMIGLGACIWVIRRR